MNRDTETQDLTEYNRIRKRIQELETQNILLKFSMALVSTYMSDEDTREEV